MDIYRGSYEATVKGFLGTIRASLRYNRVRPDCKLNNGLFGKYESEEYGNTVGGVSGEVRGKSKIETYLKYVVLVDEQQSFFEEQSPNPKHKKVCKAAMVQDPDTGEWILRYHLHS